MLTFATPKRQKPVGFWQPQQPETKTLKYRVEFSRRFYATDNSELFMGQLEVRVPELATRTDTHDLAILWVGCWLQTEEVKKRGVNQAFVFSNSGAFIDRCELQEFSDDRNGCHKVPMTDAVKKMMKLLQQCEIVSLELAPYASGVK